MNVFVDKMLLQLSDPLQLVQLLAPTTDPNHAHLLTLLNAVYDSQFATIHDVRNVTVQQMEFQKLLLTTHRTQGTWTQIIPSYMRTDVFYESSDKLEPLWLDVFAEVSLTLLLEIDSGQVESITVQALEKFNTLDEFKAYFIFIDLPAFLAEHGIKTVEELKEHGRYLLTEIRLRQPPVFDPNDPANLYPYSLKLATFIRDSIDIAATLHDIKLARAVVERIQIYRKEFNGSEVLAPYAPMIIFPQEALTGSPFTADQLQKFFAGQGILALFLTPA
jgi:hypothetical protein